MIHTTGYMQVDNTDHLLGKVARGRAAIEASGFLDEIVSELDLGVDRRVFNVLDRTGAIPADVAVQAWLEKHTYSKIRGRLRQEANSGQTAGRLLEPVMKLNPARPFYTASTPSAENGGYDGEGTE